MMRTWPSKLVSLALLLAVAVVADEEGGSMVALELTLDGQTVALTPAAQRDAGQIWVPLARFCEAAGAVLKDLDGSGGIGVCDEVNGDVCVMLGPEDTRDVGGTLYGRLDAFAAPLGLRWQSTNGVLRVARGGPRTTGLGVGDHPPEIQLPDMDTGKPVSSPAYIGKPAVFYMWASW